jgi:hypothetical protein
MRTLHGLLPALLFACSDGTATQGDASTDASPNDVSADAVILDAPYSDAGCIPGTLAWWRGENDAKDSLGQLDLAVSSGTPAYSAGKVGLAFDLSQAALDSPPFATPNGFTIEAWVMPRTTDDVIVLSQGWRIEVNNLSVIAFNLYPTSFKLTQNVFAHLAVTCGQSGTIIYWNGIPAYEAGSSCTTSTNAMPLRVGAPANDAGPQVPFDGLIDELAVYGRALTGAEIATIYDAEKLGMVVCRTP